MAVKQKEKLFEEVQFQDVERAKRAVAFAKINQIRILIGFIIAAIAEVFALIGIFGNPEIQMTMFGITWAVAFISYIVGGGIPKALGFVWKITKIGWFLVPIFPADIFIAIVSFCFSIFGILFVPVIFVGINYLQHKKTLEAAISYLAQTSYLAQSDEAV